MHVYKNKNPGDISFCDGRIYGFSVEKMLHSVLFMYIMYLMEVFRLYDILMRGKMYAESNGENVCAG